MQLKNDEIKIIQLLLASTDYISSYDIATSVGISRRSVRDKMINVKNILSSLNLNLNSKTSKGYFIEGKSSKDLSQLQNLINHNDISNDGLIPTLPEDRAGYINNRLLDSNQYIKLETLADELHVSRATITNDLIYCKKEATKYGLKYIHKPNYGIYVDGPEVQKRKLLIDSIFKNLSISNMYFDFLDAYIDSPDYEIIQILKRHSISMSDISLIDFLINYSTMISRISSGNTITTPTKDFDDFNQREEYKAVQELANYAQAHFSIKINEYEIQNLTIMLICKRSTKGLSLDSTHEVNNIIKDILKTIQKETLITIDDSYFLNMFPLYIINTLIRQKYNEKIRTPLYEEIQFYYPIAYYLSQITSKVIKKHTHDSLSRSELTLYTILFNNVIKNKRKNLKKTLLINCMSEGSRFSITNQLETELPNQIEITKSIYYHQLKDEDLSHYDLIISSAPIHHQLDIPVISINYLVTNEDIIRIKSNLSFLFNDDNILYYFHPELYENHVKAKTVKGISTAFYQSIKKLYPSLSESKKNEIILSFKNSIQFFDNSIGLINMIRPLNSNNIVSILVLEEPILLNNKSIELLVLFSGTENQNIMYNTLYSSLKSLLEDDFNNSTTYIEFISLFKDE